MNRLLNFLLTATAIVIPRGAAGTSQPSTISSPKIVVPPSCQVWLDRGKAEIAHIEDPQDKSEELRTLIGCQCMLLVFNHKVENAWALAQQQPAEIRPQIRLQIVLSLLLSSGTATAESAVARIADPKAADSAFSALCGYSVIHDDEEAAYRFASQIHSSFKQSLAYNYIARGEIVRGRLEASLKAIQLIADEKRRKELTDLQIGTSR